jgi:hypothetical protein
MSLFEKSALGLAGLTALVIGASILVAPHGFYASYGITLGHDPSLMSELRAPGAGLAALGLMMLLGNLNRTWLPVSIAVALAVYIAFPVGRLVSLAIDGAPSGGILVALCAELGIAAVCLLAFRRRLWPQAAGLTAR